MRREGKYICEKGGGKERKGSHTRSRGHRSQPKNVTKEGPKWEGYKLNVEARCGGYKEGQSDKIAVYQEQPIPLRSPWRQDREEEEVVSDGA